MIAGRGVVTPVGRYTIAASSTGFPLIVPSNISCSLLSGKFSSSESGDAVAVIDDKSRRGSIKFKIISLLVHKMPPSFSLLVPNIFLPFNYSLGDSRFLPANLATVANFFFCKTWFGQEVCDVLQNKHSIL